MLTLRRRPRALLPTSAALALLAPLATRATAPQPRAPSAVFAELRDSTLFPEGMDVHPGTGAVYVGSIRHRTIVERRADGRERELFPRDGRDVGAVMGVRVDRDGRTLWASTAGLAYAVGHMPADTARGELIRVRIDDGRILGRWRAPASARMPILGDLTVGTDGTVWMTDSYNPVLYRLRPGATALESFRDTLFRSLQGIAVSADGGTLYVADYSRGLLRILRGTVERLTAPAGVDTRGIDGLVLHDGTLVGVQNGAVPPRIVRYTLHPTDAAIVSAEVLDRAMPGGDEPTIGSVHRDAKGEPGFVYVANSQWEKYDPAGARVTAKPLARPLLLRVPLRAPSPASPF